MIAAALLAWKERLADFSMGLSEGEIRSALLLAILAIVIYPALPAGTVGPGNLIEPRYAWVTVILIAAMMPLSTAMVQSGAAQLVADHLVGVLVIVRFADLSDVELERIFLLIFCSHLLIILISSAAFLDLPTHFSEADRIRLPCTN